MTAGVYLGLDLGTKCGFAWGCAGDKPITGTWKLAGKTGEPDGARYGRLWRHLDMVKAGVPHLLALGYETVQFAGEYTRADGSRATMVNSTQMWGCYKGVVLAWCEINGVPYHPVATGTLKNFATGSGRAKKEAMIRMFQMQMGRAPGDDNEADAYHVWQWVQHEIRQQAAYKDVDAPRRKR